MIELSPLLDTVKLDDAGFGNRKIFNVKEPREGVVSLPNLKEDVEEVHEYAKLFLERKTVGVFFKKLFEGQFF